MKKEKEITPICAKCSNYEVSPGGCVETCHAIRRETWIHQKALTEYANERMNANKTNCKMVTKL